MTVNVFTYQSGSFCLTPKKMMFEVSDALRTPKGTVFGDPSYGSERYKLIDKGLNESFKLRAFKETAKVIKERFPTLKIERMELVKVGSKTQVKTYFKSGESANV